MKTIITAAALIALAIPAHASEFRESDRKWQSTADKWVDAWDPCHKWSGEEETRAQHEKACRTLKTTEKKLIANGYCVFANGGVGRPSRNRKHCYVIDWPVPEHVRYLQGRQ
jgi:hypothetical protein